MNKTAVIIPCYKCSSQILSVLCKIPTSIDGIYVVDDACPEGTGSLVAEQFKDPRTKIIRNSINLGVGGATKAGYQQALKDGFEIFIKIDGDDQMDPHLIPLFVSPLSQRRADYTKGNRFYHRNYLRSMPPVRLFGNSILSLLNKLSSGYWNIMDPTNGYTAIHRTALEQIRLDKVSDRFFFESDMLYQLGISRAVVWDIPMASHYGGEKSNLKVSHAVPHFFYKYVNRFFKRLSYLYILRDWNLGTMEALCGALFFLFGSVFGGYHWYQSIATGQTATSGTVMIAGVSVILGIQLLLSACLFDVSQVPKISLQELQGERQNNILPV